MASRLNRFGVQGILGFSQGSSMAAALAAVVSHCYLWLPYYLTISIAGASRIVPLIPCRRKIPPSPIVSAVRPLLCHYTNLLVSQFCVLVSGFKPADAELGPLFNTPLATPSVHVLGRNDAIVSLERAYTLVYACVNPRVEEHEGGE